MTGGRFGDGSRFFIGEDAEDDDDDDEDFTLLLEHHRHGAIECDAQSLEFRTLLR